MQTLTDSECVAWLHTCGVPELAAAPRHEVPSAHKIVFDSPTASRLQANLARALVEWLGPFNSALLWVTDWPFYKVEEMVLIAACRKAHGEQRPLIEAPGQVFGAQEQPDLIAWVLLMQAFGWDSHLFTDPFNGSAIHTSHHDVVTVTASDARQFAAIEEIVAAEGLRIHRSA
jgi:hypothetical protein